MATDTITFYNDLAEHYHLLYQDWNRAIRRQAGILGPLLEQRLGPAPLRVLDCACGIGTQTIGIATRGHHVVASDISDAALRRAQSEAYQRELTVAFHLTDMRDLISLQEPAFDAIIAADNSFPHLLSSEDLAKALQAMFHKLRPGGLLLATIRDYDSLLQTRPVIDGPAFFSESGRRRIVHQVWDWDGDEYTVHLYLTWDSDRGWTEKHYVSRYRAITRNALSERLEASGFRNVEWLMPEQTSFYQPIVLARRDREG